jgi:two-component system response regulator VicR
MKKRILVIDDDEDILDILNIIFESEGYHVIVSNTAAAAEDIHIIKPDLVLLDFRIAGSQKNGAQICAQIKSGNSLKHLPVMLISAESDISNIANECGANAYVKKPFDIYHLLSQVRDFIY